MTQSNDSIGEKKSVPEGALRNDQTRLIFQEGFSFSGYERDPLYLNLGSRRFLDISGVSGIDSISDGRGAVFADFDNDGDLDVFLTTLQGPCHLLFRNNVGQSNGFLRVSLEGTSSGRDAFGAVVRLKTSAGTLTKIKSGGSGFLAEHDPRLLFGLGGDAGVNSIEVTWPSGKVETFGGALAGDSVLLREGKVSEGLTTLTEGRTRLPDPLTPAESLSSGLKVKPGLKLPDIPVTSIDGTAASLHSYLKPGRKVLINLWATWCAPCAREIPELERIRLSLSTRGIDLIGLNLDTETGTDVRGYLAKRGISYLNLIGGTAAIESIFATERLTVPISVLVDDRAQVLEIIAGWSAETQNRFQSLASAP